MEIESEIEPNADKSTAETAKNRPDISMEPRGCSLPGKVAGFPVNIVGEDGRILYCNDRMRLLAGRDVTGELCWKSWGMERGRCEGCPLQGQKENGRQEVTELTGGSERRIFRVTHSRLLYNGKNAFLQILDEITETRKAQLGLTQAQRLESVGTLVSGIAHDFNNLLGIIIGNASLIEKSANVHHKILRRADAINRAAERGTSLVKQLLTFARKSKPIYTAVSINRIISDISRLVDETFPRSMRLLCNLSEDLPMVSGDPTLIHQAVLNIMVNAKDATKGVGDVIISTEVVSAEEVRRQFPAARAYEYVLVGINDNGEGMPEEVLRHIFEPFFTTKGKLNGTGLGLSVVSGIMEKHHGFVDVESQTGRGTTLSLYFPAHYGQAVQSESPELVEGDIHGGNETILIVEDEEMLNELLTSILTSNGYRVLRTSNGRQAVEIYRENKGEISLVISDFGLPNLSGSEVFTWLKEIDPDVKFILSTGYLEPTERSSIIEDGAKDIILKPYRPMDLLKKARRVLDQR